MVNNEFVKYGPMDFKLVCLFTHIHDYMNRIFDSCTECLIEVAGILLHIWVILGLSGPEQASLIEVSWFPLLISAYAGTLP
jgi:hypothetical protein